MIIIFFKGLESIMERVPYGIIGNGNVASHFKHYFTLKGISFKEWSRSLDYDIDPRDKLKYCDIIIVLIKDSVTKEFIKKYPFPRMIHFSGSLQLDIPALHPLMIFTKDLYTLKDYESIPFICDKGIDFKDYFPTLNNPYGYIDPKLRPYYHALAVLSGNFSTILWQKAASEFESKLGLDSNFLFPYLDQITKNIKKDYKKALAGPLVRKDELTIQNNIKALEGDSFKDIYIKFKELYENN